MNSCALATSAAPSTRAMSGSSSPKAMLRAIESANTYWSCRTKPIWRRRPAMHLASVFLPELLRPTMATVVLLHL